MEFRPYRPADREACLRLFDLNCPASFAPNERTDFERFLDDAVEKYELCLTDDQVVGAYGLYPDGPDRLAVRWIMVSPQAQGQGIGSAMMTRIVATLRQSDGVTLRIAASHKSAPFFAKFGARERDRIPDGWGPGMHRVEMELHL
jgi:N-acetylglutamate synthase-like GNAT family acetyltransferase